MSWYLRRIGSRTPHPPGVGSKIQACYSKRSASMAVRTEGNCNAVLYCLTGGDPRGDKWEFSLLIIGGPQPVTYTNLSSSSMREVKLNDNNAAKTYICVIRNSMSLTLQNRVSLLKQTFTMRSLLLDVWILQKYSILRKSNFFTFVLVIIVDNLIS